MLVIADEKQFDSLVDVLISKFKIILQMAVTDIWVLFSDSAENSYNALRYFLCIFKYALSHPKLSGMIDIKNIELIITWFRSICKAM
jgi:hypothetical protein